MQTRFHISSGRYGALNTSRFMQFTYGKDSFAREVNQFPEDEVHGTYGALLFDKRWSAKRLEILQRDNNRCVICEDDEKLQVHHRQYHFVIALSRFKAPWDYENYLLITMCESCHGRGHSKYKVPTIYV
jgi:hypothetical protein